MGEAELVKYLLGAGGLAGLGVYVFLQFPKWMASIKRDQLDERFATAQMEMLDSLRKSQAEMTAALSHRLDEQEAKIAEMHSTIHHQQIRITRLTTVLYDLKGWLISQNISVPPHLMDKLEEHTSP